MWIDTMQFRMPLKLKILENWNKMSLLSQVKYEGSVSWSVFTFLYTSLCGCCKMKRELDGPVHVSLSKRH